MATSFGLYVKNQTEEFIGNILLEGYSPLPPQTRIVIIDYTRDEAILRSSATAPLTQMMSETQQEKFIGFAKYLRDRKKVST
jgi:hypothetical protein